MYRISQLAEALGLSRTTLLYYEKLGIVRGDRLPNGYRQYSDADLQRLRLVLELRAAGLELKDCIKCLDDGIDQELLLRRHRELTDEIEKLEIRRLRLEALLGQRKDDLRALHERLDRVAPMAHEEWLANQGFSKADIYRLRWLSRSYTHHEDYMDDFFTIFEGLDAHGPGTATDTLAALALVPRAPATILEIGCGPGNATLLLAEHTSAAVTALDNLEQSLERLSARADAAGLDSRITPVNASMDEMPFAPASFDLIWCEASVYIMGFEKALSYWREFLTDRGHLVVSDLVWTDSDPPADLVSYWRQEYPDMKQLESRIEQAEALGYEVIATHPLEHDAWAAYYEPLAQRVVEVRDQLSDPAVADSLLEEVEMLKRQVTGSYTYVFFVLAPRPSR